MKRPEQALHLDIAKYLRQEHPRLMWFHVPNSSGNRGPRLGKLLKNMGVLKGVPDLAFVLPGGTAGFMEIKAEGQYLEPAQKAFAEKVKEDGARWACVRSLEDVAETLGEWGLA